MSTHCSVRSGALLDVTALTPADITLLDLVWPLAHQCRYNGHCGGFYSVAEHCVHVHHHLRDTGATVLEQRMGLLHDAAEAWLGDLVRPLKATHPDYREWEEHIMEQVCTWADLPTTSDRDAWAPIWVVDDAMLRWEMDHWWPGRCAEHHGALPVLSLPRPLQYWTPKQAAMEFLCTLVECWTPYRRAADVFWAQHRQVLEALHGR